MSTTTKTQVATPAQTTAADAAAVVANIETRRAEITKRLAELDTKVADAALKAVADVSDKSYANLSMELANARLELQRLDHALVAAKRNYEELHRAEQAKQRAAQVRRVEKLLRESEDAAGELTLALQAADMAFKKIFDTRAKAFMAAPADLDRVGSYASFTKIHGLVANEIYRIGGRPASYADEFGRGDTSFPGAQITESGAITKRGDPASLTPLIDRLRSVDEWLVARINGGPAVPSPANEPANDEPVSAFRNNGLATR